MRAAHTPSPLLLLYAAAALLLLPLCCECLPATARRARHQHSHHHPFAVPFQRAVVNEGDPLLFNRVYAKLARSECLNILIVGGSITCGQSHTITPGLPEDDPNNFHPDAPRKNASNAWPRFFAEHLHERYPCHDQSGSAHHVKNTCQPGVGTPSWIEHFAGKERFQEHLSGVDLVIVDTAANDIQMVDWNQVPGNHEGILYEERSSVLKKWTESLMLLLLHNASGDDDEHNPSLLPYRTRPPLYDTPSGAAPMQASWSGIACVWLGMSTWHEIWDGSMPRHGDTVHDHLPVAQRHGVPYVSLVDGFGPFITEESKAWYRDVYKSDYSVHITVQGQRLVAAMMLEFLCVRAEDFALMGAAAPAAASRPWAHAESSGALPYLLRRPALVQSWDAVLLLRSKPLHWKLNIPWWERRPPLNSSSHPCTWVFGDDGHRKPGMISRMPGESCSFFVPNEDVQRHFSFRQMHVLMLKSYEQMGLLGVEVAAVDCGFPDGAAAASGRDVLLSWHVDALWKQEVSLAALDVVAVDRAPLPSSCVLVTFTNLPIPADLPSRTSYKLKLYQFSLY